MEMATRMWMQAETEKQHPRQQLKRPRESNERSADHVREERHDVVPAKRRARILGTGDHIPEHAECVVRIKHGDAAPVEASLTAADGGDDGAVAVASRLPHTAGVETETDDAEELLLQALEEELEQPTQRERRHSGEAPSAAMAVPSSSSLSWVQGVEEDDDYDESDEDE